MSTATAKPMARGARLLFSSSTAVRSTVNTSRNVRMPSARIAQPGYTPGPRVWAPPWISLYTDSGKTALRNLITFSKQQNHTACIVMSQVRWNWSSGSREHKVFKILFRYYFLLEKGKLPFDHDQTWIPFIQRWFVSSLNWPSGSGENVENVKCLLAKDWRRRKLSLAVSSGELLKILSLWYPFVQKWEWLYIHMNISFITWRYIKGMLSYRCRCLNKTRLQW